MGAFVAWAIERTNTPLAKLIGAMLVARIIIPGILITISWILLASPNIGVLNSFIQHIFGIRNFFNIYSFGGMVWIHAIEMVPLTYLLLVGRVQVDGPAPGRSLHHDRRRHLPHPVAHFAAAGSAGHRGSHPAAVHHHHRDFRSAAAGGRPRRYPRLHHRDLSQHLATPVDWGLSSAYSMAMLVMSIVLLLVYFRVIRHADRYQTITGKDFRPRRIDLGPWRYVTCAIALLIVILTTGVPFLMMLYASFLPFYQPPSAAAFASMSWVNYIDLFQDSYIIQPLINSTILGLVTATVVVLFVTLIAYFVQKSKMRGRKLLDFLAFASIAIPGVVLGTAFMWFYLLIPLPVIGTLTIIFLAYLTKFTPFALRFVSSSMAQIHGELEEAGQVAGQSWLRNFFKIIMPLLKPGLLAAWFWVMVHAFRELTLALMLARSANRTASVVIYDLWEQGSFMKLSAFGVVIFFLLMAIVLISNFLSRRYGVQEQ